MRNVRNGKMSIYKHEKICANPYFLFLGLTQKPCSYGNVDCVGKTGTPFRDCVKAGVEISSKKACPNTSNNENRLLEKFDELFKEENVDDLKKVECLHFSD